MWMLQRDKYLRIYIPSRLVGSEGRANVDDRLHGLQRIRAHKIDHVTNAPYLFQSPQNRETTLITKLLSMFM